MAEDPNLDAAYDLQTPEDSRRLYKGWAETYDTGFVAENGYILHKVVADTFVAEGGKGPVLDIGAGTGLCGAVLAAHGLDTIDGTDISPEMLEQAATKQVYRSLFPGDILAGLEVADARYSGVVSSGTFTLGHVGPEGLDEVVRVLAPGGLAVISVRDTHFQEAGFAQALKRLDAKISSVSKSLARIYSDSTDAAHADDRAIILRLWRA